MVKRFPRFRRNISFLKELHKLRRNNRSKIIKKINPDFIKCLCDLSHNICKGNINLSKFDKRHAVKHRKSIRHLSNKNIKIDNKRKILNQKGGFLPTLISIGIALASVIIPELIKKNKK